MNPGYYGILPANVRYDKRLKPMARIMYTEITALSSKWGYCTANNGYFAKLYEVSPTTVSRWFSQLTKYGYVKIEIDESKGNERKIYPNDQNVNTYVQKEQEGIDKKSKRGIDKKSKNNNTSINTTSIIRGDAPTFSPEEINDWEEQLSLNASEEKRKKVAAKRKRFQPPTLEEIRAAMMEKIGPMVAGVEAEKFYNYYEANGWKVGRNKMQSWPHAVGGWIGRMDNYKKQTNGKENEPKFGAARHSEIEKALAIRRARRAEV